MTMLLVLDLVAPATISAASGIAAFLVTFVSLFGMEMTLGDALYKKGSCLETMVFIANYQVNNLHTSWSC